jgi:beta-barrel assembly-enhancing protease
VNAIPARPEIAGKPVRAGRVVAAVIAVALGSSCAIAQAQEAKGATAGTRQPAAASLPDLGSGANTILTRADERQIGRLMLRNLREENALLDDVETSEYLQSLGSRIGAAAQDGEQQITMFVVRDPMIQAFATPGGFIGVYTGLIMLTNSESELAGVVAHETGHVMQRHIARAVEAQGHNSITSIAAVLGAVLIGAITGSGDAIPGLIAMSQGAAMQQQINFTRMEEQEADRVGIGYLAAAGYDPNGMANFFGVMMHERGAAEDFLPALLMDHPVDSARIAEARARVATLPTYARRPDSPNYQLARERIRVLLSPPTTDLRRYYEKLRANDPGSVSLAYGAAMTEVKAGTPDKAIEILKPLVAAHLELPLLQSELAQAQLAAGKGDDAVSTFERGLQLAPRNVPLSVRYAEALLDLGKPKKAHMLLLDLFNTVAPTPEQIKLIALAASAAGDIGDAYYYMSEYHISNGNLMLATTQLDLAIAAPRLTEVQRKRFIARREEIRNALREQRGDRGSHGPPPG